MNEFHKRFGNGGKWYFNPENYNDDFLKDEARWTYVHDFYQDMWRHDARGNVTRLRAQDEGLSYGEAEEAVRKRMAAQKEIHYGQVIPMEEMEQILRGAGCIMRFGCLCRYMYGDKREFRSCYLVSAEKDGGELKRIMDGLHSEYLDGEGCHGVEVVSADEAVRHFRQMDKDGLVHTIWTLHTPFIASICNCDPVHCSSLYTTLKGAKTATLFMADYVAKIDNEACIGCRRCKTVCQFGALEYSPMLKTVQVNAAKCIGCGVCRAQCPKAAIALVDRESDPDSAGRYELRDRQI